MSLIPTYLYGVATPRPPITPAAPRFPAGDVSGYPDATNTGYVNAPGYAGSLVPFDGPVVAGTTYSFREIPQIRIDANNVTFYGCRFHGDNDDFPLAGLDANVDNITFDYCTFEPTSGSPPISYGDGYQFAIYASGGWGLDSCQQLTVTHCNFWGFANAIDTRGSTQAKPHRFEHNWLHDVRDDGGIDHIDGIGSLSGAGYGSYVVINHNTISSGPQPANTNAIAYQAGSYSHFTITNNLIEGFDYSIAILSGATYVTFTDNLFSTKYHVSWGPLYPDDFWTTIGSIWRGNRWHVPAGAAWGTPARDGWYWMPVEGPISENDTTSGITSQTDFSLYWPSAQNRPVFNGSTLDWIGPLDGGPSTAQDQQQGHALVDSGGSVESSTDGQVIEYLNITNGVNITHNNVTLRRCRITGGGYACVNVAGLNCVVEDCLVDGVSSTVQYRGIGHHGDTLRDATIRRCNILNWEDGIGAAQINCLIIDNWFHGANGTGDKHADHIECYFTQNTIIQHNNFDGRDTAVGLTSGVNVTGYYGDVDVDLINNCFVECGSFFAICDDNSQGGSVSPPATTTFSATQNGFFNCVNYRRDGVNCSPNADNFNMASLVAISGTPTNGTGAI